MTYRLILSPLFSPYPAPLSNCRRMSHTQKLGSSRAQEPFDYTQTLSAKFYSVQVSMRGNTQVLSIQGVRVNAGKLQGTHEKNSRSLSLKSASHGKCEWRKFMKSLMKYSHAKKKKRTGDAPRHCESCVDLRAISIPLLIMLGSACSLWLHSFSHQPALLVNAQHCHTVKWLSWHHSSFLPPPTLNSWPLIMLLRT